MGHPNSGLEHLCRLELLLSGTSSLPDALMPREKSLQQWPRIMRALCLDRPASPSPNSFLKIVFSSFSVT
ncbi:hypothetical protein DF047_16975 [Burkholderia cenocepacia]|nr:hypothetical protein DF047_16975 [Burkholderia cenocepacia]